ncbi:tyrosine-protein phosphatase [Haliea sp. E17]|uniref:tyrosine-protein phosphatase n=1 Tax=Haliea sp. E17 TaxID=3401576 RepID=UPI003AACBD00
MRALLSAALLATVLFSPGSFAGTVAENYSRVLPLEGGRNFRDVGGYPAGNLEQVKWGKLYRSGTLYALTGRDFDFLHDRNIALIADLRTNEERAAEPTMWQAGEAEILSWSYSQGDMLAGLTQLFSRKGLTPEDVEQVMIQQYRTLPKQQSAHYSVIFGEIANGNLPLVVHCSAGKDRTGLGIALILTALGVPRDVILQDYAMSGKYQQIAVLGGNGYQFEEGSAQSMMTTMPKALTAPLLASNPAYLEAALAAIEEEHGSVMAYIRDELGVTDEELDRVRANLLEPGAAK